MPPGGRHHPRPDTLIRRPALAIARKTAKPTARILITAPLLFAAAPAAGDSPPFDLDLIEVAPPEPDPIERIDTLDTRLRIAPSLARSTLQQPTLGAGEDDASDPLGPAEPVRAQISIWNLGVARALLGPASVPRHPLPDLDAFAGADPSSPDRFSFRFGRDTTLADGGFGALPGIDDAGGAYFNGGQRFDRYSLDLEWTPAGADAEVQWLVVGGFDAVRADISGDPRLGLTDARGTVAIPTIGTGLRWKPSDGLIFSTTAATQTLDTGGGVVDISFSAEFRLSPLVGLSAGYEFFESSMTVENLRTTLDREGVFARITIRF